LNRDDLNWDDLNWDSWDDSELGFV
jgi:hypothetical protein